MSASSQSDVQPGFQLGLNDGTLALIAAILLIFAAVTWTARSPNVEKTDFSLTYVGAKMVHDGMGSRLYEPELQRTIRDSLFAHPVPLYFEHPPFEAVALSPLAAYPYRTAYLVWGLINASIWIAAMFALRAVLPWPREGLSYVALWIFFAPLWVALYQGQSSILVLAGFALTFLLLQKRADFAAGFALGLGLVKFQFVLPFAFIFLLRRHFRYVAGFAACAAILCGVALAGVGWQGLTGYAHFLLDIGNNPQNVSYGSGVDMPTIHGLIYALLGRVFNGLALNLTVAAFSLALLIWAAWKWESTTLASSFNLMFAAAVAISLLCGSHMFTHDFSPLIIAMFLAMGETSLRGIGARVSPAAAALRISSALFWIFPVYLLLVKWHCLYLMSLGLLLFAWSGIGYAARAANQDNAAEVAS